MSAARTRRLWADTEVMLLRALFPETPSKAVAQALGRAYSSVVGKAHELGLHKSERFLASPAAMRADGLKGINTRFPAGHEPWNKGKNFQPGGRSVQTRFQAGQLNGRAAQLAAPVGSYRINADGHLEQKVSDQTGPANLRWKPVYRLVWEAAHGPIPPGFAVCFKPGRRTAELAEITEDALELVSRRELMLRNSFHRYGPEIAKLVQLRGALTRQIRRNQEDA